MPNETLADRLDDEIRRTGPMPVSRYVEAALYDAREGFYATRGRAGRDGDFLTAPEVGPLFGAVMARALDHWWQGMDQPASFDVIEWGAGPGTLARAVLDAEPDVLRAGALTWHLIEVSAPQRALHPVHPVVLSSADAPAVASVTGVVLANELLDNLPFDVLEWHDDRWVSWLVGPRDHEGRFSIRFGDAPTGAPGPTAVLPDGFAPPEGTTMPWQTQARVWLSRARATFGRGRVVVLDYGGDTVDLLHRDGDWLRTHRGHDDSGDWLVDPGTCDITADVAFDQLQLESPADVAQPQAEWLRVHGIDDLVEEGRRIWHETAGIGDLDALKARSRIREAEALLDPTGMGSFRVLEWHCPGGADMGT